MKKSLTILSLFLLTIAFSQKKRKAFTLEIAANEKEQYVSEIDESPYFVKEKIIQLYCGEKVLIECEINKDTIASMKVVTENKNPKRTIEIEFTQNAENRKEISTMLMVKNPFNKRLSYNAIMLTPMSQKWSQTSILPIEPNLMGLEMWPHPIVSLALEKWRFEE